MAELQTTVVAGKGKRVRIRPDRPSVIIGERCNTLGFRSVRAAAERGDIGYIVQQAVRQVEAGAQVLDVNMVGVSTPEEALLPRVVEAVTEAVDVPLALSFGSYAALEAALRVCPGKALINSISGEEEKLDRILPLMEEYGAAAIAMTCDDSGIPNTPEGRLACAHKVIERAGAGGIPASEFIFDCISLAIGTDEAAGPTTFRTMHLVREAFGANITLGASNASFGLPRRPVLNAAYLAAAITHGANCPMTDPTVPALRWTVLAADAITGQDTLGIKFIRAHREADREGQAQGVAAGG